jgi:hypothetical protein
MGAKDHNVVRHVGGPGYFGPTLEFFELGGLQGVGLLVHGAQKNLHRFGMGVSFYAKFSYWYF